MQDTFGPGVLKLQVKLLSNVKIESPPIARKGLRQSRFRFDSHPSDLSAQSRRENAIPEKASGIPNASMRKRKRQGALLEDFAGVEKCSSHALPEAP